VGTSARFCSVAQDFVVCCRSCAPPYRYSRGLRFFFVTSMISDTSSLHQLTHRRSQGPQIGALIATTLNCSLSRKLFRNLGVVDIGRPASSCLTKPEYLSSKAGMTISLRFRQGRHGQASGLQKKERTNFAMFIVVGVVTGKRNPTKRREFLI